MPAEPAVLARPGRIGAERQLRRASVSMRRIGSSEIEDRRSGFGFLGPTPYSTASAESHGITRTHSTIARDDARGLI
jgi:hypothetical protein